MKLKEMKGRPHRFNLSDGSEFTLNAYEVKSISDKLAGSPDIVEAKNAGILVSLAETPKPEGKSIKEVETK